MVMRAVFFVLVGVLAGVSLMVVSLVEARQAHACHNERHCGIIAEKAKNADGMIDPLTITPDTEVPDLSTEVPAVAPETVEVKTSGDDTTIKTSDDNPTVITPEDSQKLKEVGHEGCSSYEPGRCPAEQVARDKAKLAELGGGSSTKTSPSGSPSGTKGGQLPRTGGALPASIISLVAGVAVTGIGLALWRR